MPTLFEITNEAFATTCDLKATDILLNQITSGYYMVKTNKNPINTPPQPKTKNPWQSNFLVIEDIETMNPNETEDQCLVHNF